MELLRYDWILATYLKDDTISQQSINFDVYVKVKKSIDFLKHDFLFGFQVPVEIVLQPFPYFLVMENLNNVDVGQRF